MIVRRQPLLLVVALAVLCVAFFAAGARGATADDDPYDTEELEFLKLINEYRQDHGLPTLILSDALTVASQRHSEDMGRHDFFAHDTVQSDFFPAGSTPWERIARSGYDYPDSYRAENLAAGYETARENFDAWRASPGHDANMLDGNQRVIGIARVRIPGSEYGWYWTTDFGSEVDPTAHAAGEAPPSGQKPDEPRDGSGIENGAMKDHDVWKQDSALDEDLVRNGVARLGGRDDARDEISQEVRVEKGQELKFRVRVATEESDHPSDNLSVRLLDEDGKPTTTLYAKTDTAAGEGEDPPWISVTADLSSLAGETGKLSFLAKTDGERPTTFYVDDVTLE